MDIKLVETCGACPEAYDAFDEDGNYLAHLRLRYGYFTVTLEGGKRVYETCTIGDGVFECSEREYHLDKAIEAIQEHYNIY